MKRLVLILTAFVLLAAVTACAGRGAQEPPAESEIPAAEDTAGEEAMRPAQQSYYAEQNSRAYRMLQSSNLKGLVEDWTSDLQGFTNPEWDYDSFARYAVLQKDTDPVPDETLYACNVTAENGKTGYIVLSYENEGPSFSRVAAEETAYPYDLRDEQENILERIHRSDFDFDFASATALRVRIAEPNQESGMDAGEAILVMDGKGHRMVYHLKDRIESWIKYAEASAP